MNNIQFFTTPTAQGATIESYLGIVTANQVAGTGFFSDFTAGLSDFFGGNSGTYRRAMNSLYEEVMDQLANKAYMLGANGVVGVTIDYDSISAKNMSMFMVSVQGTAVKFKEEGQAKVQIAVGNVTADQLECELNKKIYKRILEEDRYLNEDQWKYVLSHDMPEIASLLYASYAKAVRGGGINPNEGICAQSFPMYVSKLPYNDAVELLYDSNRFYLNLIKDLNLFNAKKILEFARNNQLDTTIKLLKTNKSSYNIEDLRDMKELAEYLRSLPNTGKIEEVKGGIFSSGGLKFVCECGSKNNPDVEYCESCGCNIKGLKKEQQDAIDMYIEKVQTLEEILK